MNISCWGCGAINDQAAPLDSSARVKAQDRSVCLYCGCLSIFTGNEVDKRRPTKDEIDEYMRSDEAFQGTMLLHQIRLELDEQGDWHPPWLAVMGIMWQALTPAQRLELQPEVADYARRAHERLGGVEVPE